MPRPERDHTPLILALFFLSGGCTLVYELIWVRMLIVVFGTSVFAVSTVLGAFMAGLALGSYGCGRLVDRARNPLRIYAILEAGIAAFAILFPLVLVGLDEVYTLLYRALGGGGAAFSLARPILGFAVLLVPTTLMGGTLPVLSKFLVDHPARLGRRVGGLYAANTFGAVAGCVVTAFVLVEHVGIREASWVAAAVNLLVAAAAFGLSRRTAAPVGPVARASVVAVDDLVPAAPRPQPETRPGARLVLWAVAITGFSALGFEIAWTRLLCVVLQITTTQSLALILVVFLFGLATGGAIGARYVDRWEDPLAIFGAVVALLGIFGLISIGGFSLIPQIQQATQSVAAWWGHFLRLVIAGVAVMLIPTCLMGLLFPIAGRLHARGLAHVGTRIGDVYAANTAGAILGALATGFALIPLLGTTGSLRALAALNLLVGAALLLADAARPAIVRAATVGILAIPVVVVGLFPPTPAFEVWSRSTESRLLYRVEGAAGTVTVHERARAGRILRVNGAGEVATDYASLQTFRLLGSLPLLLHPSAGAEVLVIAFGGGITLAAAEAQRPARIDCVEMVPGVLEAARFFAPFNNRVHERLEGAGIEVVVEDGRNHLLRTEREYDVIISDATHPGTADSWVLYTEEFYRLCRRRLRNGGLIAQWVPLHGLTDDDYRGIVRTFATVFPHTSIWLTRHYSVLLGTPGPLRIDLDELRLRLRRETVREALAGVDLDDPRSFLSTLALAGPAVAEYAGSGAVNTDNRSRVSFSDHERSGSAGGLAIMMSLADRLRERAGDAVTAKEPRELLLLDRRLSARRRTLFGHIALKQGARERALALFRQARSVDPEEPGALRALRNLERRRPR